MFRAPLWVSLFAAVFSQTAKAEEYRPIADRASFLSILQGKQLTRLGVRLNVLPSGEIRGRAFGKSVTGAWRWENGFFCRDLYFGQQDLGPNCQMVKISGDSVRFIADRGNGEYADLNLR